MLILAGLSVAVLVSERLGVGYRYDLEPYLGKVLRSQAERVALQTDRSHEYGFFPARYVKLGLPS